MIIWSGYGALWLLAALVGGGLPLWVFGAQLDQFDSAHYPAWFLATRWASSFGLAALYTYTIGIHREEFYDPALRRNIRRTVGRDTLFFIPVTWLTPIFGVIVAFNIVMELSGKR